MKIEAFTCND